MAIRRQIRRRVRRTRPVLRRTPSSTANAARTDAKQAASTTSGLMIGGVHDPAEKAADQVANRVMRKPAADALPTDMPDDNGEDRVQAKPAPNSTPIAPGKSATAASPDTASNIRSMGNGKPLGPPERSFFESRMNADLSSIRIHDDAAADKASKDVHARAFTHGKDIAFAKGEHQPETDSGRHLMAHELAHTQQQGSRAPKIRRAMKFEYQVKKNRIYRDDGKKILPLPRKFGPQDFLVEGDSGVKFETETRGQPEFETGWERNWAKLGAQITDAYKMTKKINAKKDVEIDGVKYKPFPFGKKQTAHLRNRKDFRLEKKPWRSRRRNLWRKNQRGKRYESNRNKYDLKGKDTKKTLSRDTVMGKDERLLVKVNDRDWTAYIQSSESFSLDQFESFLKEHPKSSEVAPVIKSADRIMSARNPKKLAAVKLPSDASALEHMMAATDAQIAKATSDRKFSNKHTNLRNFLLMIIHYIKMGRANNVKGKSAKFAMHLLNRTNFGSVYKTLLSKKEKYLFKKILANKRNGLFPALGVKPRTRFFVGGHAGGNNPTLSSWLWGITKGKDRLSGKGMPGAMGRHRVNRKKGKHKGLIRYETRRGSRTSKKSITPGEKSNSRKAVNWRKHAFELFRSAATKRKRDAGKGKTGLKFS